MEALPPKVDVVVLGTGLPESIVAAACARSGLSVLHLDRNNYYGGSWSSFNLRTVDEWQKSLEETEDEASETTPVELADGESLLRLGRRKTVKRVRTEWKEASEATTSVTKRNSEPVEMTYRAHLEQEWRRFSIDLVPKMIVADSDMVQTLVDSEVAKYAEFKMVDRFLCMEKRPDGSNGLNYCPVPCSRGEIFQSKNLSMMDKRRLMMFMDFCQKWKTSQIAKEPLDDPVYEQFKTRPFEEFLESEKFKIVEKLRYFITDAIGILHPNATTEEGLEAVCTFVNSTGRFGASPFLFPLYGCGELPQCFCRLCAVFGGLYCLSQPIESVILNQENRAVGVVAAGQRIDCSHLIMSNEYVPEKYVRKEAGWICRAVHITNRSILTDPEKERISLVNLAQLNPSLAARLFESGFEACSAPRGYYVLNLTGNGDDEDELAAVERTVFSGEADLQSFWSLHFSSLVSLEVEGLPQNVAVVSGADESLEFASVLKAARSAFKTFWNEVDFLPKVLRSVEEQEDEPVPSKTSPEEVSTVS